MLWDVDSLLCCEDDTGTSIARTGDGRLVAECAISHVMFSTERIKRVKPIGKVSCKFSIMPNGKTCLMTSGVGSGALYTSYMVTHECPMGPSGVGSAVDPHTINI